jgi:imidazole glycerol-phosphate synthase subunit HisF
MNNFLRVIPVLFIKNGLITRSQLFEKHQIIGNIIEQAKRLNTYNVDELIYVDISRDELYDLGRDDLSIKNYNSIDQIIEEISKVCFMPLTFGGKIRNLFQAINIIRAGADKIILNTLLFENVNEVKKIVKNIGSQAVIASIDYKVKDGVMYCFKNYGKIITKFKVLDFLKKCEDLGVGEFFLQNIDKDGMKSGFDIENLEKIINKTSLPVIACSGAGSINDFIQASQINNLSAIAAGNYFNFTEHSYPVIKKELKSKKINVR